jgi:outer membrane immunogenic protein
MHQFSIAAIAAASAITFTQNASAADLPVKAPVAPIASPNWTGFYIGLNTGADVGTGSASQDAVFSSTTLGTNGLLSSSNHYSPYGWVVGGQLGYNKQISNWVVGVEADWQWTSQKAGSSACTPPVAIAFFGAGADGFGYCLAADQKLTNFGTARARGGILTNENLLWYLTGGLAWGTVKENLTFAGSANPTIFPGALQPGPFLGSSVGFSTTKVGWTLGAGVETKLGGGWSAKLEYLFVDLGSVTETMAIPINPAFGPAFNTGGVATATSTAHVMDNIVRVGLNYTFGQNAAAGGAASNIPAKAPMLKTAAASTADWTGFYIGLNTGGDVGTGSASQNAVTSSTSLGTNGLLNSSDRYAPYGWVVGGQLGYNKQISSWVVGVEADWQWTSQKAGSSACTPPATLAFFGSGADGFGYCLAADQKLTNFGTARARGGILTNENLLWYLTGGLAWGTIKENLTFAGSANSAIFPGALQPGPFLGNSAGFSTTKVGWTLGAGVETKLGGGWSAKLEYLFVDLGSVTNTVAIPINPAFGPVFNTGGVATATSTAHVMDNIVRVGLNYTFK